VGNTPVVSRVFVVLHPDRNNAENSTPAPELTSDLHSAFLFTRPFSHHTWDNSESAVPVYQPSPVEFGPRSMPKALQREQLNAGTMRKNKYFHAKPASRKKPNIAHRLKKNQGFETIGLI